MNNPLKDKHGNIVLWQNPNLALWGWIVSRGLAFVLDEGTLSTGISQIGTAFLFVWSYLEIKSGVSPFRRLLGGLVLAGIIAGYFKAG